MLNVSLKMVLHYCSKPANRMHIIYILRQHILVGSSESCLTIFVLKLWVCCIHEWFRAHRESTHHSVIGNACTQREIRMLRRHILMQHVYSCVPWRQRELCLLVYIYARFPWVLRSASFWLLLLLLFNFWLHCAESLEGNSMWCEAAPDIYLWHPERQHRSWCRRYIFTCLSTLHMMQAALAYSAHVLTCDWMTQVLPNCWWGDYLFLLAVVYICSYIHANPQPQVQIIKYIYYMQNM